MIALRLLYARERARLEEARESEEGRKLIRAETRTLIRPAMNGNDNGNGAEGASTMRISLRDRRVTIRWIGEGADRMNQLFFTTADEAREEYFRRLEAVERQGYIDASAGELA
jgi:hypothetical protein